ncbi:MAG: hypothetical protein J6C79_03895 [Clostridia bacterium]|nr:hypothetical protein [Clostridia bacterium]
MIDIHTHILPHLDDGAKNTATSVEMLGAEKAQGVKTVVCTPHYYGKRSPEKFLSQRNAAYAHLKDRVPSDIDVRLGAEVHFTGINVPDYDELCKLAIEGTKYILIELPFVQKWTGRLLPALADFAYDTGYTPIIAHVERYREVLKKPSIVSQLVDMGCLIQLNARAFTERKERKFAFALLSHGYVHCIGSDGHDVERRSVDLLTAQKAVEAAGYAQAWTDAQSIMERILRDEEIRVPLGTPIKKFFGSYR